MHNTGKKKAERLAKEVRRHERKIKALQEEKDTLTERLRAMERVAKLLGEAYRLLIIRVGLAYGEDEIDKTRGKAIGKRLRLPRDAEPEALLAKWQANARKGEDGATIIGVGLRDDPDDYKSDAELAAEAEAYRKKIAETVSQS